MTQPGEFVAEYIVTAADMNALPGGVLGYAQITSGVALGSTSADVTGLSITVSPLANRRIRVTGSGQAQASSGRWIVHLRDGSDNTIQRLSDMTVEGAIDRINFEQGVVLTPSAGSVTYKMFYQVVSGSGHDILADAAFPAWIMAEDIGPA